MIWYELSKNRLHVPNPEKYTLVCTYLSLMELAFTPNNFKNLEEVQNVIRKILSVEPELIMQSPVSYARGLIDSDFKVEYKVEEDLVMGFLRVLLNHPKDGLNNEFRNQLNSITSIRTKNNDDWANFQNELYKPSKEMSHILKKYSTAESYQKYFKSKFAFLVNQYSPRRYSKDQIDWDKFELYEKVSERYLRNMDISKLKADRNDENDLKNMIYVQPEDKYWTLEKRWLSMIKEIKLDEYLYTQPNN
jgi:hypothetical protein